jgi:glycosyltransferase involved in cell wall biosynthesis
MPSCCPLSAPYTLHPNSYTLSFMLPVAFVSVSSALGGSEWVLHDLVTRARRHDIEPTVVLPKEGPLGEALQAAGVPVCVAVAPPEFLALSQRAAFTGGGLVQFGPGLWRWSRAIAGALDMIARQPEGKPAILYSNGFKAHLACALVRGCAHVWHLHEFPPARIGFVWRLLGGALPDAAIANSAAVAGAWHYGPLAAPSVVLNGVDTERFKPGPKTFWIHDLLELPHEARLIGMPAVFARWKGHLQVVDAFERIASEVPDAHLVLVGGPIYDTVAEAGYAQELSRRVRRSSQGGGSGNGTPTPLSDRIHFVKFQTEPWTLYREFDLVVHFSTRPEPFGRVVLEAMACGIPVIAAAAGGPAEILEDGLTGWLTAPNDVPRLGERMVAALRADTGAMRAAARSRAERLFTADRFAADVAAVVLRAARAPKPATA